MDVSNVDEELCLASALHALSNRKECRLNVNVVVMMWALLLAGWFSAEVWHELRGRLEARFAALHNAAASSRCRLPHSFSCLCAHPDISCLQH